MNPTKSATLAKSNVDLSAQKLSRDLQQIFTATSFTAIIEVSGIDADTGRPFQSELILSDADPEFRALVNDLGARINSGIKVPEYKAITPGSPAEGLLVHLKNIDGAEFRGYRFMHDWFDEMGFRLKKPLPVQYKVMTAADF